MRVIAALFMLCVAGRIAIEIMAPSSGSDGDVKILEGGWKIARQAITVAVFTLFLIGLVLQFVRRSRMRGLGPVMITTAIPNNPEQPRFKELTVCFDDGTDTWLFSGGDQPVAAFSEIGALGRQLNVFGRQYEIPGPSKPRGGVLGLDGKLVAKGLPSKYFTAYEITAGESQYRLRRKFFTISSSAYRLVEKGQTLYSLKKTNRNCWKISGTRTVNTPVLVFAFWLVRQDINYKS